MATVESETFVRALARGLRIIEVLGQGDTPRRTVAEIAEASDLPRSVAKRFALTLTELGYTGHDGKRFWLTPKVMTLGLSYLYALPFWRQAQLALEELSAEIGQSCAMSVLDGHEIVYVVRVPTYRILRASPTLGSRLPAHAVSMGRVLLSNLPAAALEAYLASAPLRRLTHATVTDPDTLRTAIEGVRNTGSAWVDAELDESICGLAVPVRDADGTVVAAVNVSLPSGTFTEARARAEFLAPLRQTAARIRAAM
ncbi:IclR family transcriptional regulator C-terminal domain-containing protein [Rhodoplanes sp. TEM]|uniref:IclR family transcriptional regulator C-terminal domain-containing protein n=1 Tax=Rhodoplanes tepidamans TaxID=200616 RepID=A0ABT5JHW5_RHOTP|nr:MULTISPECIES: IclR family transcriptional regulator C-terminal domain-containing protein [Rhodoplanes]MDC7789315.1 IclR family transcriptional regulator C-terminal domain-containing protein [Rhodoplanes tepidamans]MDC7986004.1 IclR family transcriptional regulator C-terminal domain-containing protein [Rhodoplanes sp. TEM]MDQ0359006.1 IclR family pca regulon transcriptional regulator [Rhodoplanes tepidamans]